MKEEVLSPSSEIRSWTKRRDEKNARLAKADPFVKGRIIAADKIVDALETSFSLEIASRWKGTIKNRLIFSLAP